MVLTYLHLLDPEIPIDYMRLYGCIWIFYGIIWILYAYYIDILWDYNELYGFIWGKKVGLMEYLHLKWTYGMKYGLSIGIINHGS